MIAARRNEETIMSRPKKVCQIRSHDFPIAFESPPAVINPNPPIIRFIKPQSPAMINTNFNSEFRNISIPVNLPVESIPDCIKLGGVMQPIAGSQAANM